MMKEIYRYKGKHVLYYTGEVEETDEAAAVGSPKDEGTAKEAELTSEQMSVVLGSMSDNRISDSVKDIVAQAEEGGENALLTEEQRRIVSGSMSDNRISDSVKDIVAQNT